jgi:hypothetical protein
MKNEELNAKINNEIIQCFNDFQKEVRVLEDDEIYSIAYKNKSNKKSFFVWCFASIENKTSTFVVIQLNSKPKWLNPRTNGLYLFEILDDGSNIEVIKEKVMAILDGSEPSNVIVLNKLKENNSTNIETIEPIFIEEKDFAELKAKL